jgi:hypothetical protein
MSAALPRAVTLDTQKPWVCARCPCGGTYTAGYFDGDPSIVHSEPACAAFLDLECDAFLEAMRKAGAKAIDGGGTGS